MFLACFISMFCFYLPAASSCHNCVLYASSPLKPYALPESYASALVPGVVEEVAAAVQFPEPYQDGQSVQADPYNNLKALLYQTLL